MIHESMKTSTAAPTPRAETATFLFTDLEGSTRLLQSLGEDYPALLERHLEILRTAVEAAGGRVFGTAGDAIFAAFGGAGAAVEAAAQAQRELAAASWPGGAQVCVRMGLHTGDAIVAPTGYTGITLHRVARICDAGWGGQVLLSQSTRDLAASTLPPDTTLRDLGEFRLKDLAAPEHLHQLTIAGLRDEFPPLRSLDDIPNNLPTQLTSFVGRHDELAAVAELLENARLVTLTGPGGTGKTRLSLQAAADVTDHFPDGVWFVPLAAITDPDLVAPTILAALGLQSSGGQPPVEQLTEHLAGRRALVVLDNFEQVLGAAPLVTDLLRAAPDLSVLVTSRAALRVYGEQEYPVPPLHVPDMDAKSPVAEVATSEAVGLFLQRAAAVKPDFRLEDDNARAVAEIVARLDGLPLAIELAAARVKLLSPQAMVTRLSNRLGLLTGGARDLPTRQQTLRDAIEWSYELLDDASRRLLLRLSVFAGGATLDAAEAVCGPAEELGADVLDGLGFLVDQSLVRQQERAGDVRFTMLETIREFAEEQLAITGDADEIRSRHAAFLLDLAETAAPQLTGPDQAAWLERVEAEHDNFRAALTWARDNDVRASLRLVTALWRMWQIRGHLFEARRWADQALALPDADADRLTFARANEAAGGIAYWQGDVPGARRYYEASLEHFRMHGDDTCIANALYNLSFPYSLGDSRDEMETGRQLLEESLVLYERIGDRHGAAKALWGLGDHAVWDQEPDRACDYFTRSLAIFREVNDPFMVAWSLHMLGVARLILGEPDVARPLFDESLHLFVEADDVSGLVLLLDDFYRLAVFAGDRERAARLKGALDRLRRETGADLVRVAAASYGLAELDEDAFDPDVLERLLAEGAAWSNSEAVAYALEGSVIRD